MICLIDSFEANKVLVGISDWAQINGRDTVYIEDKAKFDCEYGEIFSLKMDIWCFIGIIANAFSMDSLVERGTKVKGKNGDY